MQKINRLAGGMVAPVHTDPAPSRTLPLSRASGAAEPTSRAAIAPLPEPWYQARKATRPRRRKETVITLLYIDRIERGRLDR